MKLNKIAVCISLLFMLTSISSAGVTMDYEDHESYYAYVDDAAQADKDDSEEFDAELDMDIVSPYYSSHSGIADRCLQAIDDVNDYEEAVWDETDDINSEPHHTREQIVKGTYSHRYSNTYFDDDTPDEEDIDPWELIKDDSTTPKGYGRFHGASTHAYEAGDGYHGLDEIDDDDDSWDDADELDASDEYWADDVYEDGDLTGEEKFDRDMKYLKDKAVDGYHGLKKFSKDLLQDPLDYLVYVCTGRVLLMLAGV